MLEEERDAALARSAPRPAPMPSIEPRPRLGVRRLERVVVALDPGPDDEVRAELAGEVGRLERAPHAPRSRTPSSGETSPPLPKRRVEVQPARDAVDVVAAERVADLVEVVARELLRVVELVAVDQVAEAARPRGAPSRAVVSSASSGW